MTIETYSTFMTYLYSVLFLLSILFGIFDLIRRICKKDLKCWWAAPWAILYFFFAIFGTFGPYNAYDDVSNPDYWRYKDWKLHNFILNNIKILIIWLLIGAFFYFIFDRKSSRKSLKIGCSITLLILILFIVLILAMSVTKAFVPITIHDTI